MVKEKDLVTCDKYIYQNTVFTGNKGRDMLRLLRFICSWWRTIPCQVAYALAPQSKKDLVLSDFGTFSNTVKSLIFGLHNRTLFYHRMGRTSIVYSWLLNGDSSIKLPFSCKLGKHVLFVHNDSCHLNAESIGDDFVCYPHVVLGTKNLKSSAKPVIGNNVVIGTGAVVVGGVKIGNNVRIGANAFVCQDVPDNSNVIAQSVIIERNKEI